MASPIKKIVAKLWQRCAIKIPQVIIEEQRLEGGSQLDIIYGKNYTVVVIIPSNIKLNERMTERISILVNEQVT